MRGKEILFLFQLNLQRKSDRLVGLTFFRFPFDELLKWKHPGLGNKDVSDTKDDDEDKEDDNADEKDDDGADEDFSGEEGDPEDDPEANGDGGSGEEEDDNERGC
ncbi:hypothetical protein V6Z11_D06G058400 [Gossypium hirsutum]